MWISIRKQKLQKNTTYKVRSVTGIVNGEDVYETWDAILINNRFFDINNPNQNVDINDIDDIWVETK
jgi:hypothetical protein